MIIDSLGGEPLAERIGETSGWRQFALYRAAPSSGNLTVTFALTGLGEVCIDDVSVRVVRRGGANSDAEFRDGYAAQDRRQRGRYSAHRRCDDHFRRTALEPYFGTIRPLRCCSCQRPRGPSRLAAGASGR